MSYLDTVFVEPERSRTSFADVFPHHRLAPHGSDPKGPPPSNNYSTSTQNSDIVTAIMAMEKPAKALLFDVFGTCVDWRTTVTRALHTKAHHSLNSATASIATSVRLKATDMTVEHWGAFAQEWRNTYMEFTQNLAKDASAPWKTVDEHHFDSLKELLAAHGLDGLWDPDELREMSLIWHHLKPWSDSAEGIRLLNRLYYTATLSNGNLALLSDLKKNANLEFTHTFSAEQFGSYKPSPKVYLGACERLGLKPEECAMVAAHLGDLKAAKSNGLRAIYVERPLEERWSTEEIEQAQKEGWVDVWVATDEDSRGFITVADRLGIDSMEPAARDRLQSAA